MLRSAVRDLQWRRRRFAIAVLGVALVFGMTLVITGVSAGFGAEAARTVTEMGASQWIVAKGADGPFLGAAPFPLSDLRRLAGLPGIVEAAPTVYAHKDVVQAATDTPVNVFGAPAGSFAMPAVSSGRRPLTDDEIAISNKLRGYPLGSRVRLGGSSFTVVGIVDDSTALAGTPNVFLPLHAAQLLAFAGLPVASAMAVKGHVRASQVPGFTLLTDAAARADLLRALRSAQSSITFLALLLWLVAAMIVGSVIYVSVLERQRDFAVFKAIGISTGSLLGSLAIQAVLLSLVAAVIGSGVAAVLGPNFPMPVALTLRAYLLLPLLAVAVGLVASLSGLRKAVAVEPALAFGGP